MTTKVNKQNIQIPHIKFTSAALKQWHLISLNDFTLKDKNLRLLVSGKGCDGFSYSVGFTAVHPDDFQITVDPKLSLTLLMDPFTAFYLQTGTVDYIADYANNNEGFVVINDKQKNYHGKFWRQERSTHKIPPTL